MLTASTPLSRRTFLQAGSLPAVGLALPQLLAALDPRKGENSNDIQSSCMIALEKIGEAFWAAKKAGV